MQTVEKTWADAAGEGDEEAMECYLVAAGAKPDAISRIIKMVNKDLFEYHTHYKTPAAAIEEHRACYGRTWHVRNGKDELMYVMNPQNAAE